METTQNTPNEPVAVEIVTPSGYTYTNLACPVCGANVTLALDPRLYYCNHVKRCGWKQTPQLTDAKQITWTTDGRSYTVKRLARGNGQLFVTIDGQIELIDELESFDNFVRNYLVNAAGVAGVEVI